MRFLFFKIFMIRAERRFIIGASGDLAELFGGIQPSKQAAELARKAISLGEDPTHLTKQAGIDAQKAGRKKAGLFGGAERHLAELRNLVTSIEGKQVMAASTRRANRK